MIPTDIRTVIAAVHAGQAAQRTLALIESGKQQPLREQQKNRLLNQAYELLQNIEAVGVGPMLPALVRWRRGAEEMAALLEKAGGGG